MKAKVSLQALAPALALAWTVLFAGPAAATITLRGPAQTGSATVAGTFNISMPAGTIQNDVMITAVAIRPYTATIAPPAGWTPVGTRVDQTTGNTNSLAVYYKVAGPGEAGPYSWTFGNAPTGIVWGIMTFAGVNTTTPIDVNVNNGLAVATGITFPTQNVSTSVAYTMVVTHHEFASSTAWAFPTGMAEAFENYSVAPPTTAGISMEGNYVLQAAAGATGVKTANAVATYDDTGATHITALRPCTAPAVVSYAAASARSGQVTIHWSSSAAPVIILKKASGSVANTPDDGRTYILPADNQPWGAGGATVVYVGSVPATSFTDTSVSNGTPYYYKVFPNTGTGGGKCYASGTEVNGTPPSTTHPAWSYMMAGGSILEGGTAGTSTIYTTSNAGRIISLNTPTGASGGAQVWQPVATTGAIQGYVSWLPLSWVRSIKTGPGTGAIAAGVASGTISISPALTDTTKTILFFQGSPGSDGSVINATVRCALTNTTTITCDREGTTGAPAVNIRWQTVEFYGGVTVQHLTGIDCDGVDGITEISVNPVGSMSNTFLLYSQKAQGGTHGSDDFRTVRLINTSQVETREAITGCITGYAYALQVVQYTGASVTRGLTGPMAAASTSVQVSGLSSADPSKTMLLYSWRTNSAAAGTVMCDRMVRGEIASATSVRFTRGDGGAGCAGYAIDDIAYERIEFTDGTRVQQVQPSMAAGVATADVPITKVDTARSVVFAGGQYTDGQAAGEGSLSTDDIVGAMLGEHQLTSATNLRITRSDTSGTARWTSYVVEFPRTGSSLVVIGGDQTGRVYSVDAASGAQNWAVPLTGVTAVQAPPAAQLRGWSNSSFTGPVLDDLIFAVSRNAAADISDNKVYALRARDNGTQWVFDKTTLGASNIHYISGMPYVDYRRNRLYVASRAGTTGLQQSLWVIDTRDGSYVASFALGHLNGSPTLSYNERTLYVGNEAGTLYALDLGDPTLPSPPVPTLKWLSNPAALGTEIKGFVWEDYWTSGRLYFTTADGNVWRLDDPGASPPPNWWSPPVWKTKPVAAGTVSTPLLLDGTEAGLYVGGSDGNLYKLDPATGAQMGAAFPVEAGVTVGSPSTENSTEVFVGTSSGRVYKIPLPLP